MKEMSEKKMMTPAFIQGVCFLVKLKIQAQKNALRSLKKGSKKCSFDVSSMSTLVPI